MATVDTLLVRIEADMKDLKRGLRQVETDVQRTTNKASASFKKLGGAFKLIAVGVVVRQAFIAGKAMVNLASDIEEMQGKSKVVFGQFRDGVVKELTAFGDAVGRSSHELEGMASTVQDTFVPMGFARGEAAKLSVEMTKLAVDVASFNNASDTDTMNAFQSALVGNHETVRRFGVVITEATLNQELLNMGIEDGAKAATNAQKVQARLNLITDGVKDAQGDAARTAESYANQMKGLRAEFSELVGALGKEFLPMLVSVIKTLRTVTQKVKDFLQAMNIIDTPFSDAMRKTKLAIVDTTIAMNELQVKIDTIKPGREKSLFDTDFYHRQIKQFKAELITLDQSFRQMTQTQIAMPPPREDGSTGDAGSGSGSDSGFDIKAYEKQSDAYTARTKAIIGQKFHEDALYKARKSGDLESIENAIAHQKLTEIQLEFNMLSDTQQKRMASTIAENIMLTEARTKADAEALEITNKKLEAQVKLDESIANGINVAEPLLEQQKQIRQNAIDVMNAFNNGDISAQQMSSSLAMLAHQMEMLNPIYAKFHAMANDAFNKVTNDLTDMAMSGKFNLDTLKETFKNTMRDMVREAIRTFIIKKMLQAMLGGIGGAIGGPAGNFIAKIGTSASGGSLSAGQPQIVGERGAELIVPKSASTVLNHHNTKNAMSGGNGTVVNQTINVDSGVSQTVRAEMLNLLPIIKQDTLNAVIDGQNRGGSFSKAFA